MSVMSSARHNNVVQADDTTGHVRRIFRAGFALVPCGHARFCEASAMRVSDMAAGCPVCRTDVTMVMRIFS